MIRLIKEQVYFVDNKIVSLDEIAMKSPGDIANAYKGTIAYKILNAHNKSDEAVKGRMLNIRFDSMASHDITYVGIIQTAKGSGMSQFPLPYVLTNCHNSLCAVGGTINEDDHVFGLSAAKKYGGIFVPPHQAVIHTYMREMMAGGGKMILGSDSHTRYGALGTMAIGEGGPELVKQLLNMTYNIMYPEVIAVELKGKPRHGVGPQDVALAIIKAVFSAGFVKNKIMEFVGAGIASLPVEFRNGIDVMTTETACLSSIWMTDNAVMDYLDKFGRKNDFIRLMPENGACYDGAVIVDLDKVTPQIAMPFHPSNVYSLSDVIENPYDVLSEVEREGNRLFEGSGVRLELLSKITDGRIKVDQGVIAGCAGGTYDNIYMAANILKDAENPYEFSMSVYPSSQPVYYDLARKGALQDLIRAGAIIKTAFCGPCFGAGDVPSNNGLSIRHTTRNFESREGAKRSEGQIASVALMDSRSIAATSKCGGYLTSAAMLDYSDEIPEFEFDDSIYKKRVYYGYNKPDMSSELKYAPSIVDWPEIQSLKDNLILKVVAVINDPVTTTDELIPSGETSSYRSNPLRLAEFALSRKVPEYVGRAKSVQSDNNKVIKEGLLNEYADAVRLSGLKISGNIQIGSVIFAVKPGDGSAREQAASCQRVLGGSANIAREYATKRYRSNLINWGMLPFINKDLEFKVNDIIIIPDIKDKVSSMAKEIKAALVREDGVKEITLLLDLDEGERDIILSGCLMNYYSNLSATKEKLL